MSDPNRLGLAVCFMLLPTLASMPASAQDAAVQAPAPAVAPAHEPHYSNKWRIAVSEGANTTATCDFDSPQAAAPVDIKVHLKDGRGEDGSARDIRDAFKAVLDKKSYKVELDDGEDVLVKKHNGPDFTIELLESTVKGTRVNFRRE